MAGHIEIDYKGIAEIARGPAVRAAVSALAERIAAAVRAQVGAEVPVLVAHYTTDREAAAVTIATRSGMGLQAKHGVLTRAAGAAGLEVRVR